MDFKLNKFEIVKNAISYEVANFCYNYLMLKREVAKTFFEKKFISEFTQEWGYWDDLQVPNTYSHYADVAMEILLLIVKPKVEQVTNLKLIPNYSYTRIYKKGDVLKRHKDRFSCEISTTLNLGGDPWPIFLKNQDKEEIQINLNPGDMLVYEGITLEHWREEFKGEHCAQVFLHYNNIATQGSEENKYDKRPHLGLPPYFKKN
jgi:hypothetical protein